MFLKISKKHGFLFFVCVVASFILTWLLVRGNTIIAMAVDTVIAGEALDFRKFIIKLGLMAVFGGIAAYIMMISRNYFSAYVQNDFKNMAAAKVIKLEYKYFDDKGSGSVLNKLISDINEVGRLFSETLPECVVTIITTVTITVYMCTLNFFLTIGVLAAYPIMIAVADFVSQKLMAIAKQRRDQLDERTQIAYDAINGIVIGRSYNLFDRVSARLFAVIESVFRNEERRTKISSASHVLNATMEWIPTIICYVSSLVAVINGSLSVGEMLVFVALVGRVTRVFSEFPFYVNDFREIGVSVKRLEDIMGQEDEPSGNLLISKETADYDNVIEFDNVRFSYDGERDIFKNLSFKIQRGKKVAFVGGSGQGKSTVFRIMCGFYGYSEGTYKLYGKEFPKWDIISARNEFALVSQNVFLFPESIEKNIAYGKEGATKEEVIEACKKANIHDFIMSLPEGYDTMVGERGVKVSGGERQRISIARAILKNAQILLLDEPTSAVDVGTEELITDAINEIAKDRTVIIIAHRLSTVIDADEIMVFQDGRIVESGSHKELLLAKGSYSELYGKECENKREGASDEKIQ